MKLLLDLQELPPRIRRVRAASVDEPERMESDDQEVPGTISPQANVVNNLVNKALNHKVPATIHRNEVERMDVDDHDASAGSQPAIVTTPVIPVTEEAAVVQNHEVQANAAQKPIETEIHKAPRVEANQNKVPAAISPDNMIKSDVPTAINVSAGSQSTAVTNSAISASCQAPADHCPEVQADGAQNMEVDLPAIEANHLGLPADIPSLTVVNSDATLATGGPIGAEEMKTDGRTTQHQDVTHCKIGFFLLENI